MEGVQDDQWRRFGVAYRQRLVDDDEASGGTVFRMHKKVKIQRYFALVEKVSSLHEILGPSRHQAHS